MTKAKIFISFFLFNTILCVSQPIAEFASKTIDFGQITEGTVAKHRFVYKNTGDQPLIISHVSVTCGCTASKWSKEPLSPGDTASIYVEFDSKNKMGPVAKGINLMTNCTEAVIGLIILADIQPDLTFKPTYDSTSQIPLKIIYYKNVCQVFIPTHSLKKAGFKGTKTDAEKLIKIILKEKNMLLFENIWITIEGQNVVANMRDVNLLPSLFSIIHEEVLNKKTLKKWVKKAK